MPRLCAIALALCVGACNDPIQIDDATSDTGTPPDTGTDGMTGSMPATTSTPTTDTTTSTPDPIDTTSVDPDTTTSAEESTSTGPDPIGCPAGTHVVFLNRDGGTYQPGLDDATMNRSGMLTEQQTFLPWDDAIEPWDEIVACLGQILAPYDIMLTDLDPGAVPHLEVVMSPGGPADNGFPANVGAIAPSSCDPIANTIGFVFGGVFATGAAAELCAQPAFIVGATAGLEHTILQCDVMSQLGCPSGDYAFADVDAPCGGFDPMVCQCGGDTQNSHARMLDAFGPCP